jgi:pimeloyl-ACP methyl ester carboxylesterase
MAGAASRFGRERIAGTVSAGRVRAAGLEIAYDRVGGGPPLVLVHGGLADAREWRPQLAGLSDDFTVIAWDEPGAGRSSDVPADFGLAGYGPRSRGWSKRSAHRRTSADCPGAAP